mgnify:CR=1 FL=1
MLGMKGFMFQKTMKHKTFFISQNKLYCAKVTICKRKVVRFS